MDLFLQVDGKQNAKIQSIFLENFPIFSAHFSTDGNEVIMSSEFKWFYSFDMMTGKVIRIPQIKGESYVSSFVVFIGICFNFKFIF